MVSMEPQIIYTDLNKVDKLVENLRVNVPDKVYQATLNFGDDVAGNIKVVFVSKGTASPRGQLADQIRARGTYPKQVEVTLPFKAAMIDHQTPHYVGLNHHPNMRGWVKKHYGTRLRGGLSNIRWKPSRKRTASEEPVGMIYVTPDPFVGEAFRGVYPRFEGMLKSASQEAIEKSIV